MTAPVASGRVGLAPTGKRRLGTAHTLGRHCRAQRPGQQASRFILHCSGSGAAQPLSTAAEMRRRPRRSSSNWTIRLAFRILPLTDRGYSPSPPSGNWRASAAGPSTPGSKGTFGPGAVALNASPSFRASSVRGNWRDERDPETGGDPLFGCGRVQPARRRGRGSHPGAAASAAQRSDRPDYRRASRADCQAHRRRRDRRVPQRGRRGALRYRGAERHGRA